MLRLMMTALAAALLLSPLGAAAQAPPPSYGAPIGHDAAMKAIAAAEAEAKKNNWLMVIAVVDSGSRLVAFSRMDGAQLGSIHIAMGKAMTSNNLRRPTKDL
jgi:glc operon protein GlcG